MKTACLIPLLFCFLAAQDEQLRTQVYWISSRMVLKTGNRDIAADSLLAQTRRSEGWLVSQTKDALKVRIPTGSMDRFFRYTDSLGVVTDRIQNRIDFTTAYLKLVARLQAKESLINRYLDLLDSSGTEGIYPVSRHITDMQRSIEEIKGELQGMLARMDYADVTVDFVFFDRRTPLSSGHSDFKWLNDVNLSTLLEDFGQ